MTADQVFSAIRAAGGSIERDGDRLNVAAPRGAISPDLRAQIVTNKAGLLAIVPLVEFKLDDVGLRAALEEAYTASEDAPGDNGLHQRFLALLREYERREDAKQELDSSAVTTRSTDTHEWGTNQ